MKGDVALEIYQQNYQSTRRISTFQCFTTDFAVHNNLDLCFLDGLDA